MAVRDAMQHQAPQILQPFREFVIFSGVQSKDSAADHFK